MDIHFMKLENDTKSGAFYIDQKPGVAIPYMLVLCLASISGTLGNILVIGAVVNSKNLRQVGNLFIVNLALADLCVTGFVDPFSIAGIIIGEWWFEDKPALCELIASVCLTSCFCSLLSIGVISFNRYIHICHNSLYQKMFTIRKTVFMAACIWLVSFLLEMPNFFGWGDHSFDKKTLNCVFDRTAAYSYTVFFATVGVVFPVSLITFCYAKLYIHVRKSKLQVTTHAQNTNHGRRNSMKLARTLFIIFMVLCMCWTPYALVIVLDKSDVYPQELYIFVIAIAHFNSSLNWILYGVTNRDFRRGYARFLRLKNFNMANGSGTQMTCAQTMSVGTVEKTVLQQGPLTPPSGRPGVSRLSAGDMVRGSPIGCEIGSK